MALQVNLGLKQLRDVHLTWRAKKGMHAEMLEPNAQSIRNKSSRGVISRK